MSGAVWLAHGGREDRDPSLRLKNGYAQDDKNVAPLLGIKNGIERVYESPSPDNCSPKKSSRPTVPCDGPRMNPSVDVGCPPRPFRHLRMTQRCTPDPSSSRAPVHSALVQISVTAITNAVGRLSKWMLGKSGGIGKRKAANSWQMSCN